MKDKIINMLISIWGIIIFITLFVGSMTILMSIKFFLYFPYLVVIGSLAHAFGVFYYFFKDDKDLRYKSK